MEEKQSIGDGGKMLQTNETDMRKFRRMLGNAFFSDMLFLCGHAQEEVPASRMLVAVASPVLETMLLQASTKLTHIALPEIDASTMRVCLEFFYTGTVQYSSWPSYQCSMKVIAAAIFFAVEKLAQLAIFHLCNASFRKDIADISKAYNYGVALHHAHPDMKDLQDMLQKLSQHIGTYATSDESNECYEHLSEQAMVHLLQNLRFDWLIDASFIEYARFYHVTRWCYYRLKLRDGSIHPVLDHNTIDDLLPWCALDDECFSADNRSGYLTPQMSLITGLLAEQLPSCLQKFPLDLSKIPSPILCKVIEPLNIIPSSMLLAAYRMQALSKADMAWDEFGHGKNYVTDSDDISVMSCASTLFQGFARCNSFTDFERNLSFHWEIVVLNPCEHLRIGFCWSEDFIALKSYDEYLLGNYQYSVALSSDGFLYYNLGDRKNSKSYCAAFHGQNGIKIGVHLCMYTCFFSINNVDVDDTFDVTCENPGLRVYPAISMQQPGKVQIRMLTRVWTSKP